MGRLGLGLGLGLVTVSVGLGLGLGLGLALGLQLGIGIGFRRNHSWSSTFTPKRNHSLCQCTIASETEALELLVPVREFGPRLHHATWPANT